MTRTVREDRGFRNLLVLGVAFVFLSLMVQGFACVSFYGYCDENWRLGSGREAVCQAAASWGYLLLFVLPPTAIAVATAVAYRTGRTRVLWQVSVLALVMGCSVPLLIGLMVGY